MKDKKKKLKAIKKLMGQFSGVQKETYGNRISKTINFEVADNEDITSSISALLEVCYYALDGNGGFVSPKHENKTQISSVSKVLEIIIDLLPHDQMFCLHRIEQLLSEQQNVKQNKKV
ncbi:hypothetical protein VP395_14470 [Mariniflexile soesokkakense]|uniref:Uncharacterized protein n=1 Tax=Mariniflexile soesokkakense TaxID=1343160 RepID=A0ABV0AGB6_9FLAO